MLVKVWEAPTWWIMLEVGRTATLTFGLDTLPHLGSWLGCHLLREASHNLPNSNSCPWHVISGYPALSQSWRLPCFTAWEGRWAIQWANYNKFREVQDPICLYPGAQGSLDTQMRVIHSGISSSKNGFTPNNSKYISVFKMATWTWSSNDTRLSAQGSLYFPFPFRALACHLWGLVNELQQLVITTPQVSSQSNPVFDN